MRYIWFIVLLLVVACCDDPSRPPGPTELYPGGIITFTFDDGLRAVYDRAVPIFKEFDMPATVYVITGMIDSAGYMTNDELHELSANGWEIGSHTVTHPHLSLEPDSVIAWELRCSREQLSIRGHVAKSFATPYGDFDERVKRLASEVYETNRNTQIGHNDIGFDPYDLKIVASLHDNPKYLKSLVDSVAVWGTWGIFYGHRIGTLVEIKDHGLRSLLAHADTTGVKVLTVRRAMEALKQRR